MGMGFKRVLAESRKTGSLFSLSGEATFPTGNRDHGLGGGVTVLEGFASYGQLLPRNSFLQFQSGVESPTNTTEASRAVFWRAAAGTSFSQNRGMGRMWTPIVELLADRDLSEGSTTDWDLVPQFQVTLSRRQHVRANVGFQFPLNHTAGRAKAIVFYLLWDFFDGGLLDGWK
jgi:hypothetical protein